MSPIDLNLLLKLRLAVARFGEMDSAGWWNTNGVLSEKGAQLYSRGLPKTHYFAQARVVFAVARARCKERFAGVAGSVTLWELPAELEDSFDAHWEAWIESSAWPEYFEHLQTPQQDLLNVLKERNLLTPGQETMISGLRRSAEERAILISGITDLNDDAVTLLAAAFSRGERGKLAVPYAKLADPA